MANWWDEGVAAAKAAPAAAGGAWWQEGLPGRTPLTPRRAADLGDALIAGLQNSATGLAVRGKLPNVQLDEESPWYHRLAANAAGVAADLPLSAVAAAPAVSGGPVAMGAAAFAAPMALRDALVQAYNYDHAVSWDDAWDIGKAALKGGAQGAVIGGATAGAGRIVSPMVQGAVAKSVAATSAELATLTATSAAVSGHMPTWQDFMDNAILLVGMKGAMSAARGMRNIYAETGKKPAEVLADARADPTLLAELQGPVRPGEAPLGIPQAYRELAVAERVKAAIDADPRPELIRAALSGTEKPPALRESRALDPVKYEYIAGKEEAAGVLRAVTEMYQREITTQTRGVVPNKETAAQALQQIAGGKIGEHVVGDAANAAEIYARAHMLRGATNHALTELQKLADIPAAELTPAAKLQALASLERVAMLKAEVEGVGAEAGRSLQIFRAIKRDPSFLGEAETLLKLAERKGALQDIATLVSAFKDPAQMAEFARKYVQATTTEKVLEAWKAAILSGPQTHLANVMGNSAKWALDVPENILSATFTAADRALKGDPLTMAQYKARALAPLYGVQFGAVDSLKVAAEVWRQKGEHLEKADVYRTAIEGKTGEAVRIPFRVLQVQDAIFRTMAERAEAHIMAVDRASREGLSPNSAEYRARVIALVERPELGLSEKAGLEAIQRVQNAGAEAVFSQRLGPRMETLQRAMAGHPIGLVIPFVRTPANLVSWAVQHTPGFLLSARWRADWAAGGEAQARAVSRVVVGTGLAMTAYSMAESGLLTGGGLFEKEDARTKTAAGWQPYSLKIGDKYYSYQRMEPVAKVLGVAADLLELSKSPKLDPEDRAKAYSMLVLMFGNATVSTTYLSGLSNAMQSVLDPERYGENFLEQYAKSVVPKIIGQTTEMADPYKREVNGVVDAIQSQLPFLREKLLPKRDVWGEPAKGQRLFEVMPIAVTQQSEDRVRTEAMRLSIGIADAPKFVMESGPFDAREKRVRLTDEQRDIFREVSGKSAMTILAPIVNSPDWDKIPDFAKAAIYKDVLKGARKEGEYAALPPDAEARARLREKIINKIIDQTRKVQGE